ncbi:hypothetical protein P7C73_g5821, partial [Tremellales sp. Uapishka_1]
MTPDNPFKIPPLPVRARQNVSTPSTVDRTSSLPCTHLVTPVASANRPPSEKIVLLLKRRTQDEVEPQVRKCLWLHQDEVREKHGSHHTVEIRVDLCGPEFWEEMSAFLQKENASEWTANSTPYVNRRRKRSVLAPSQQSSAMRAFVPEETSTLLAAMQGFELERTPTPKTARRGPPATTASPADSPLVLTSQRPRYFTPEETPSPESDLRRSTPAAAGSTETTLTAHKDKTPRDEAHASVKSLACARSRAYEVAGLYTVFGVDKALRTLQKMERGECYDSIKRYIESYNRP